MYDTKQRQLGKKPTQGRHAIYEIQRHCNRKSVVWTPLGSGSILTLQAGLLADVVERIFFSSWEIDSGSVSLPLMPKQRRCFSETLQSAKWVPGKMVKTDLAVQRPKMAIEMLQRNVTQRD